MYEKTSVERPGKNKSGPHDQMINYYRIYYDIKIREIIHGLPPFIFNTLIEINPDMDERSKVKIQGRIKKHCLTFCKNVANMFNSKEEYIETVDKPHKF